MQFFHTGLVIRTATDRNEPLGTIKRQCCASPRPTHPFQQRSPGIHPTCSFYDRELRMDNRMSPVLTLCNTCSPIPRRRPPSSHVRLFVYAADTVYLTLQAHPVVGSATAVQATFMPKIAPPVVEVPPAWIRGPNSKVSLTRRRQQWLCERPPNPNITTP